jgi:hypothetical protein
MIATLAQAGHPAWLSAAGPPFGQSSKQRVRN